MKTLKEKLSYLAETKAVIKDALVEQGQIVTDSDSFRSYADKIKAIDKPTLITDAELELDFSGGDMPISAPDGYAFTGGTIKKPETLIPENIAKDVEVAGIVGTHEGGGGGSVEGTATVAFCNYDGTELFSRLVFVGDNCPDPIAQGKINEPTRESTEQYTYYAYEGWSLTAGGTASASALNVVMEDRTVYAAFVANVRYYTVRFYDGTTLMKEEQVAYGSKATEPETSKDGYDFIGWTPSDLTIYVDTDFYGTWEESTYASLMPAPDVVPSGAVVGSAFFDNDNKLVTASSVPMVYDVSGDTPTKISQLQTTEGSCKDVAAHPNGTMFVLADYTKKIYMSYARFAYNVTSSGDVSYDNSTYFGSSLPSEFYYLRSIRFNRDGSRLMIGTDTTTYIYDSSTKPFTLLNTISGTTYARGVWGADNDTIYYALADGGMYTRINKYTISTGETEKIVGYIAWGSTRPALNHNETRIACSVAGSSSDINYGSGVSIYDVQTKTKVRDISLKTKCYLYDSYGYGAIGNISYSPDGKVLAVACKDNVYFYDATDDKYTLIESNHAGYSGGDARNLEYNSDGTMVAVSTDVAPYIHLYKIEVDGSTQTLTS